MIDITDRSDPELMTRLLEYQAAWIRSSVKDTETWPEYRDRRLADRAIGKWPCGADMGDRCPRRCYVDSTDQRSSSSGARS